MPALWTPDLARTPGPVTLTLLSSAPHHGPAPVTAVTTDMEINPGRIGMEKREWTVERVAGCVGTSEGCNCALVPVYRPHLSHSTLDTTAAF